jgi:hypothetical protein
VVARRRAAIVNALLFAAAFIGLELMPVARAHAQQVDSARVGARRKPPARTPAPDTLKPPISPKRAFFYSLLVPGYGQSVLQRPIAGSLFFGAEGRGLRSTRSAFDLILARISAIACRPTRPTHRPGPAGFARQTVRARTPRIVMHPSVLPLGYASGRLLRTAHREHPLGRRRFRIGTAVMPDTCRSGRCRLGCAGRVVPVVTRHALSKPKVVSNYRHHRHLTPDGGLTVVRRSLALLTSDHSPVILPAFYGPEELGDCSARSLRSDSSCGRRTSKPSLSRATRPLHMPSPHCSASFRCR